MGIIKLPPGVLPNAISSSRSMAVNSQCVRGYGRQMISNDPLLLPLTGFPDTGLINDSRPAVIKRTSLAVWIASLNQPTEVSAGTSITVPIWLVLSCAAFLTNGVISLYGGFIQV